MIYGLMQMLRFTRHGLGEMIIGTLALAIVGIGVGWFWWPAVALIVLVWVWLMAFFRDPQRAITAEQHALVSPADGKVSDITEVESCELLGNVPAVRIGIFLSVFNVHVNRAPCDGKVTNVIYTKGKFINAMSHSAASEQNESNTLVISDLESGKPVAVVKQIVGLIARRIVCASKVGDTLSRGQRIGMIKFGSRTELYIPKWLEPQVRVQVGQKVCGARDVLAVVGVPISVAQPADDSLVQRK